MPESTDQVVQHARERMRKQIAKCSQRAAQKLSQKIKSGLKPSLASVADLIARLLISGTMRSRGSASPKPRTLRLWQLLDTSWKPCCGTIRTSGNRPCAGLWMPWQGDALRGVMSQTTSQNRPM